MIESAIVTVFLVLFVVMNPLLAAIGAAAVYMVGKAI